MIDETMNSMGVGARRAAASLARSSEEDRNNALLAAANAIRKRQGEILAANAIDMSEANERGLSGPMLDRLMLDAERIEGMATGIEAVAQLPDPLGRVIAEWDRPNGLSIQRVSVPLGVIGIIYESRPNVTADAGALCLKSGNAAILRGGSESFHSSQAIYQCMREGLGEAGIYARRSGRGWHRSRRNPDDSDYRSRGSRVPVVVDGRVGRCRCTAGRQEFDQESAGRGACASNWAPRGNLSRVPAPGR
jgi:gamma-glutamyl phosphate reductase